MTGDVVEAAKLYVAGALPEIIFLIYKFGQSSAGPATKLYLYEAVCEDMAIDERYNVSCAGVREDDADSEDLLQARASNYMMWMKILQNIPAFLLGLFCGGWSDVVGRKLPMMLPCFGGAIVAVFFIIVQNWLGNQAVPLILLGVTVNSFLGRNSLITMATHAYVTDVSSAENRTRRMATINSMNFFGLFAGALLIGLMSDRTPFWTIFACVTVLYVTCLVLIVLFLPETRRGTFWEENESKKDLTRSDYTEFYKFSYLRDTIMVLFRERSNKTRGYLLALYACVTLHNMCKAGEIDVLLLYVKHTPLGWSRSQYGFLLAFQYANVGLMCLLALPILSRYFRDSTIVIVFVTVKFVGFIILSRATASWMVFVANVLISTFGMIISCLKSTISKLVDEDEAGKCFSLIASSEVVSDLLGAVLFTQLYNFGLGLSSDHGRVLPFYVMAGMHLILLLLAIYIARGLLDEPFEPMRERLVDEMSEYDEYGSTHSLGALSSRPHYGAAGKREDDKDDEESKLTRGDTKPLDYSAIDEVVTTNGSWKEF